MKALTFSILFYREWKVKILVVSHVQLMTPNYSVHGIFMEAKNTEQIAIPFCR